MCTLSSHQHPSHQNGTYITPTGRHHPEFMSDIGVTLGVACSVSFDKYIMTCIHPSGVTQSVFTALRVLCVPPVAFFHQPFDFFLNSVCNSFFLSFLLSSPLFLSFTLSPHPPRWVFIGLSLAALNRGSSLAAVNRGFSLVAVHGLRTAVASPVEHGRKGERASVVAAHGLSSCGSRA